jgi:predicted acyl esterase
MSDPGPYAMRVDKDVCIPMRDGAQLRANVYRPDGPGRFPVLMTLGPYGKDVHLSEFMPEAWAALQRRHPEILQASSCRHLVFETPDPEVWVPHGYVLVKVDSRGAGKSPGFLDPNSPAEFRDFYDAIGWAGAADWSSGRVGLLGISYFAAGQWMIASMRPPALAAMVPWQGASDFYRDRTRQGGIFAGGFTHRWWNRSVLRNQHGNPDCPLKDLYTGERNTGPASLAPEALRANRVDYPGNILAHPLDDAWYRERSPDFSKIDIPALVVANWGGLGLHLRGTIEGYRRIASSRKWLKIQRGSYFLTFLAPQNVALQRAFFDRYLKGIDNGWENQPPVEAEVRSLEDGIQRTVRATRWPLETVQWEQLYLDAGSKGLMAQPPAARASTSYAAMGEGVAFMSAPFEREVAYLGPVKARLFVASDTADMDLFVTLRAWHPDGREVVFFSATEPKSPVSQGWLRVSQRKTDPQRSSAFQPFHTHDAREAMVPGEVYAVDVEVWPMSIALSAGARLELRIQGKDFERAGETGIARGSGFFLHDDPADRPPAIYGGTHRLYSGPGCESFVLMPRLPSG